MRRLYCLLGIVLSIVVISQHVLAENAIFDPVSKVLTVPNVEIGDEQSLYNIKLQLEADGSLSLLSLQDKVAKSDKENKEENFLYDVNPFLVNYKIASDANGQPAAGLADVKSIANSEKWTEEKVIGTFSGADRIFTFYEDGSGELDCLDVLGPDSLCQDVSSFNWTIDNYGNLIFGTKLPNGSYYRFVWALVTSEDENTISAYSQTLNIVTNMSGQHFMRQETMVPYTKQ